MKPIPNWLMISIVIWSILFPIVIYASIRVKGHHDYAAYVSVLFIGYFVGRLFKPET